MTIIVYATSVVNKDALIGSLCLSVTLAKFYTKQSV